MKYDVILAALSIMLASCGSMKSTPEIPQEILAELQTDKQTMFNMNSEINWSLEDDLKSHTKNMKPGETLLIYIKSNGGGVDAAESIINIMSRFKTICVADTAMSAAFEIYQSCTVRVYLDKTVLMTHRHSMSFGNGSISVIEAFISSLDGFVQETYLLKRSASRMNMTYDELLKKIEKSKGEWYIYGKDIVKYNASDYHIKDNQLKKLKSDPILK
jgi:ATP-dependent protease ClpP protease subunit